MMVAQRSTSPSYESLPTEEGGFPSTASSRNASTRQLMVTHQPATRCKTLCITASLVMMLLITATVLGVLVALAADPEGYQKMLGGRTTAHGKIGMVSGSFSDDAKHDEGDVPHLDPSKEGSGTPAHASFSNDSSSEANPHTYDEVSASTARPQTSTTIRTLVLVATPSTTSTTTPTTATTQSSSTTPTTTTTSLTVTHATSTTSTTTIKEPQMTSTTVKPRPLLPPINIDFNVTSDEAGATNGNGSTGSYAAHMGVVDYMIVMQSKMPPGLLVTILVFTVVGAVVLLAVVACTVKKRLANARRRAHVRQAINELRAHDKSSLLQGDEDGEM